MVRHALPGNASTDYASPGNASSRMTRVLLVPDLPLERWPSMDRYAHRLHDWLESTDPGFEVRLAASIGYLSRGRADGCGAGGFSVCVAGDAGCARLSADGL